MAVMRRREFVFGFPWFFRGLFHHKEVELSGLQWRVMRYGHSPRRFLVIHGDEDTARDVLSTYMFDHEGVAHIVTGKTRNVEIAGLKIDPNRFFSRVGAEKSLLDLNQNADRARVDAVLNQLDKHREKLLHAITPGKGSRLFALHNNRDYSVNDELDASDQMSIRQPDRPRNFFLCTDPRDFEVLRQSPCNVVLQTRAEPDDGSL